MSKKTNISVANVAIKELVDRMNELQDSLDGTDNAADSFKSAMGEMASIIKSFASALEEAKKKAEPMTGTVDEMREKQKELKSQVESATEVMSEGYLKAAKRLKDVNFELAQQRKYLGNDSAKVMSTFTKIMEGYKVDFNKEDLTYNEMRQLNDIIVQLQDSTSKTSTEFNRLTEAFKNLTVARQKYENDFKGKKNRDIGFDDEVKGIERLLQEAEDELRNMAYRGLTGTEDYQKKIKEAGEYRRAIDSVSFAIDRQAMSSSKLQDVFDAMRLGNSVFGVISGSMAAFGVESERLEKTLVRLNGILVITNSLQEINEMLTNKASIAWRAWAKFVELWNSKMGKVKLAGLFGAISVAVYGVIKAVSYFSREMTANNRLLNEAKAASEETIVNFRVLKGIYDSLGDSLERKNKFLEDYADNLRNVGAELSSVSEAEELFAKNSEKYIDYLVNKSLIDSTVKRMVELREAIINDKGGLGKAPDISDIIDSEGNASLIDAIKGWIYGAKVSNIEKNEKEYAKLAEDLLKLIERTKKAEEELGISRKNASDKLKEEYQKMVDEAVKESEIVSARTESEVKALESLAVAYKAVRAEMVKNKETETQIGVIDALISENNHNLKVAMIKEEMALNRQNSNASEEAHKTEEKALRKIAENGKDAAEHMDSQVSLRKKLNELEEESLDIIGLLNDEIKDERKLSALKEELDASEMKIEGYWEAISLLDEMDVMEENIALKEELIAELEHEQNKELSENLLLRRRINLEQAKSVVNYEKQDRKRKADEVEGYYSGAIGDLRDSVELGGIRGNKPMSKLLEMNAQANLLEADMLSEKLKYLDDEAEIERTKQEIYQKTRDAYFDAEDAKIMKTRETLSSMSAFASATGELFDTVGKAVMDEAQRELEAGKITEKEAEKRFEKGKRVQLASTWISTLAGAIEAYMGGIATIPGPAGIALGSVLAATAFATGVARHREIKATTLDNNGGGSAQTNALQMMAVQPLLDQTADTNALTTLSIQSGQYSEARVYILESDIQESSKKVEVRESSVDFK